MCVLRKNQLVAQIHICDAIWSPNPIYEGPMYGTVRAIQDIQPLPPPAQPPTAQSKSTETPSNMNCLFQLHPRALMVSLEITSWNTINCLGWLHLPLRDITSIVYSTNITTKNRETHTILDTPTDCHTLQFEVLAENSVGKSAAGVVSGGFPVGMCI